MIMVGIIRILNVDLCEYFSFFFRVCSYDEIKRSVKFLRVRNQKKGGIGWKLALINN